MQLLKELYSISSPSRKEKRMRKFICDTLKKQGIKHKVDKTGNIYATKGVSETYPCVVSHIDEVHSCHGKGFAVVHTDDLIFGFDARANKYCGIGADDKNGIWVCLKCLEEFDAIKCVFFVGEEVGCYGSSRADMTFFDDCRYVLQCDRKGNSDLIRCIAMDLNNAEVQVTTSLSLHAGVRESHLLRLADYGETGEFYAACAERFPKEENPIYRYPSWENIPSFLINHSWICPNIFIVHLCHSHEIKISKDFAVICPFSENGHPTQSGLGTLQYKKLKRRHVVGRPSSLLLVGVFSHIARRFHTHRSVRLLNLAIVDSSSVASIFEITGRNPSLQLQIATSGLRIQSPK